MSIHQLSDIQLSMLHSLHWLLSVFQQVCKFPLQKQQTTNYYFHITTLLHYTL